MSYVIQILCMIELNKNKISKILSLIDLLRESAISTHSGNNNSNNNSYIIMNGKGVKVIDDQMCSGNNNENDISMLTDVSKIKRKIEKNKQLEPNHTIKISDYSKKLGNNCKIFFKLNIL